MLVGDAADETHFGYHFLLDPAATSSPRALLAHFGAVPVRRDVLANPQASFADKYSAWMRPGLPRDQQIAGTTALIVERWLPRLLHNGDIHGMRSGVEARVPFADTLLLALAATVSPAAGLADGEKTRLRAALRGVVPEAMQPHHPRCPRNRPAPPSTARRPRACSPIHPSSCAASSICRAFAPSSIRRARSASGSGPPCFSVIALCHFARHHGIP